MLTLIGGFLLFITIIIAVICLPIMILIGKTLLALKGGARQTRSNTSSHQNNFHTENRTTQAHDVIDTTCTVISEEAV